MGNSDSQLTSISEGAPTPKHHPKVHPMVSKHRSLSPQKRLTPNRADSLRGSFRSENDATILENEQMNGNNTTVPPRTLSSRRTRSFRNPHRIQGSFRVTVCPITGMTISQKKLITNKWKEMDRQTIIDLGKNVLETTFKKDPRFLKVIDLEGMNKYQDWKAHLNFRIHLQRFCAMLAEVIRTLDDPQIGLDRLREFGASYAIQEVNGERCVPSGYWETLAFAINNAAKDLQIESSRSSESPLPSDRRLVTRDSDGSMNSNNSAISSSYPTNFSIPATPRRMGSVCPITADAWNQLALHISSQMKFAYEMERLLQAELKKLSLNVGSPTSPTSEMVENVFDTTGAEDSTPPCASPIGSTTKIPLSMQTCV